MATDAGELVVKISADIADMKAAIQLATQNIGQLGSSTVAVGNIMADAFKKVADVTVSFVKDSIEAFAKHEEAMTRLSIVVGKDAAGAFEDYAQQLQKTTAFSDDAVLSLESQLAQYGIYPGSVREATKALLDFSAVTGRDLPEAGAMLAKALSGQSRDLKQYHIDVSTAATRSQNLATVVKGLETQFHGAAETMRGTTLGAVSALSNQFEELKKRIGEDLAPVTKKFLAWASEALTAIERLVNGHRAYADTLVDQKAKLNDLVAAGKAQVSNGVALSKQQQDEIKTVVQHIAFLEKLKTKRVEQVGAAEREIASIRSLKDGILNLEQEQQHLAEITALTSQKKLLTSSMELAQMEADEKNLTQFTEMETQKRLLQSQASWEANASFADQFTVKLSDDIGKMNSDWVNLASGMIDSFSNATAKMIVEGGKFADMIKNLWVQIAEQVIAQILRMIAEWMIWMAMTGGVGPGNPFNFIGRGAAGGMINEPSMIIGLRSKSSILAGEAGPEAFGPPSQMNSLNAARASSSGGGSSGGGGGDITVNISGQFLEGSASQWQRLVQEQIIPELRRFSMKEPIGVVNRKRGALA